jgi:hypothetical protein
MKIVAMSGILAFSMAAQTPTEPPPLVQLIRKPNISAAPARPYAEAKATVNVVGMIAVTGTPEMWLVEAHQSFASIGDLDKAAGTATTGGPAHPYADPTPDDVLLPGRTMIAMYRPDFSYRADQAIRMFATARYFHISIYRVPSGAEAEFGDLVRSRRAGMDKANLDRPDVAYQVISGAASGTYVFLAPLVSFRALDDTLAKMPLYFEAVRGGKSGAEAEISREHLLFRVDPRISYVSDDFAAADPAFWRGMTRGQ